MDGFPDERIWRRFSRGRGQATAFDTIRATGQQKLHTFLQSSRPVHRHTMAEWIKRTSPQEERAPSRRLRSNGAALEEHEKPKTPHAPAWSSAWS